MIQQFVQEYPIESMARFSDFWNKKKNKCGAYFYLQLTMSVQKNGRCWNSISAGDDETRSSIPMCLQKN
jgi:hypothetical protein